MADTVMISTPWNVDCCGKTTAARVKKKHHDENASKHLQNIFAQIEAQVTLFVFHGSHPPAFLWALEGGAEEKQNPLNMTPAVLLKWLSAFWC